MWVCNNMVLLVIPTFHIIPWQPTSMAPRPAAGARLQVGLGREAVAEGLRRHVAEGPGGRAGPRAQHRGAEIHQVDLGLGPRPWSPVCAIFWGANIETKAMWE